MVETAGDSSAIAVASAAAPLRALTDLERHGRGSRAPALNVAQHPQPVASSALCRHLCEPLREVAVHVERDDALVAADSR